MLIICKYFLKKYLTIQPVSYTLRGQRNGKMMLETRAVPGYAEDSRIIFSHNTE